jgi:hypothetical protein
VIRRYIESVYTFSIRNRIPLSKRFFACDDLLSLAVPVLMFLEENTATSTVISFGEGGGRAPQQMLGTHTALRLIVQPCDDD